MSDVSLPAMQRRSGVEGSRQVLGVLAAEEMLDRAASLPPRCSGPLLLLLLAGVCEGLQSLSTSESEDESEEKRRESVRPASATRRRLRSAVPSRLHAQLLNQVTCLRLIVMHADCSKGCGTKDKACFCSILQVCTPAVALALVQACLFSASI